MSHSETYLSYVWDYDISEQQFRDMLAGRFGLWVDRVIQTLLNAKDQDWQCQVLMIEMRFARLDQITGEL
ncbi:MAG: hypothetical protein JXA42_26540 [Anaerolineales bacterium]|nr:hypothetical protein [Anaerolineales bacterium]